MTSPFCEIEKLEEDALIPPAGAFAKVFPSWSTSLKPNVTFVYFVTMSIVSTTSGFVLESLQI